MGECGLVLADPVGRELDGPPDHVVQGDLDVADAAVGVPDLPLDDHGARLLHGTLAGGVD